MKLTEKKAIEISIELWTWLAETGGKKWLWDGWNKYGGMRNDCPLCEYASPHPHGDCLRCPYYKKFGCCYGTGDETTIYDHWEEALAPRTRKKYAKLFLEQLKEL